jgi:tryptophan synthase beta chain
MSTTNSSFDPYFDSFGGAYVPETLRPYLDEVHSAFLQCVGDERFRQELADVQRNFIGRPTPLLYASNASRILGGAQIYLKLEGLANTGAHKINNAYGQALVAQRMGRKKIITETGAGQHGIATACVCARLGMQCTVFMGERDTFRQKPNVYLMELFGAEVVPVRSGTRTLTDAVDAAFAHLTAHADDTYYLIGSALGPFPYPHMVREFQSIVGREMREQFFAYEKRMPDMLIACVGGGSNAIGFFGSFLDDATVRLVGVEAGGTGEEPGQHAQRMAGEAIECVQQGYRSMFLCDAEGGLAPTASISAGLDYAGIGPQLASLGQRGRIEFTHARDEEVLEAFKFFARHEGIVAAMESSHALAAAMRMAPRFSKGTSIVVNVSGRGDKDLFITAPRILGRKWEAFLSEEIERLQAQAQ